MENQICWLIGLMDGEGCVGMNPRQIVLQLHSRDKELIDRAKAVYDDLGIAYKEYVFKQTYKYKEKTVNFSQIRLVIHRKDDIRKFAALIGFTLVRQRVKLGNLIATFK